MYLETLIEYNFLPYICIPTRITDNSATIIDHINVRLPVQQIHNKISSGNLINDISDHLPNYFIIDQEMNTTKERPLIRLYNQKNIKHFKRNIQQEPLKCVQHNQLGQQHKQQGEQHKQLGREQ